MHRAGYIVFSLLLLGGCQRKSNPQQAETVTPVGITQASRVIEPERVVVSGSVSSPGASSLVAFLVPGRVTEVLQREGEPIKKGQVLAQLDAINLRHALAAAHAQSEAAKAGYQRAASEHQRMKQLFDSQSLAPNDYAKFEAAAEAAKQQYEQALAGEGIAKKNLADASLKAPVGGYLSKRLVEPGMMAAPGQPAFEISNLDPVEVNLGVPETDIRLVKVGQSATVTVPALNNKSFQGCVKVVNVSSDPATRTYMTRVSVPNPKRELKVGMVADVTIVGSQKQQLILVPTEAIVRDPQGATLVFQYYPDQKRVFAKRVEVGGLLGRHVQIRSGLMGEESIVMAGQHKLRNGMLVSVQAVATPEAK